MAKKRVTGTCRICGRKQKLTFEHVPPGATYNKNSVKIVSYEQFIAAESKGIYPWEIKDAPGKISQRGKGDYYLCEECNNKTGAWYGTHYRNFVGPIMYVLSEANKRKEKYAAVELCLTGMRPLAIFKQVITMFCDINSGLAKRDQFALSKFLLDKYNKEFDSKKYRVFMFIPTGAIERTHGVTALLKTDDAKKIILISEIVSYPVGFALYIDLPEGYEPEGTDITDFVKADYDDKAEITITLNVLEINNFIPGDYRTKNEIIKTIEESERWETEHMDLFREIESDL